MWLSAPRRYAVCEKKKIENNYRISRRATRHVSRQRALHFAGKCVVVFIGGICEYVVIASLQVCCPIEKVLQVEQTSYTVHVTARSPTIRGRRYQSLYTQHSMRPWGCVILQQSPVFSIPSRNIPSNGSLHETHLPPKYPTYLAGDVVIDCIGGILCDHMAFPLPRACRP